MVKDKFLWVQIADQPGVTKVQVNGKDIDDFKMVKSAVYTTLLFTQPSSEYRR